MYYKIITITSLLVSIALAENKGFEYEEASIKTMNADGKIQNIMVKREIPGECKKVPIDNEMIWTGDYANIKVPTACKSTFIHTTGKLLPMHLHEDIETYGELEILAFIRQMQKDDSMILIDGRKEEWYNYRTIPGAINMPFHHFKERSSFEFEFDHNIKTLGVVINKDETLDFSKAKTIAIFCNGPWCSQSVAMITALLDINYPPEKIYWYRGGMQSWLGAGMTSTKK
ncbi:rhodanese-like domain-containing protein [Sulfurovum sp.]|uniref:rhodanese-like domain-containing protein n=1 Tax=Sulfurovum sp. TaxID=1969726 RepID=UPI002867DA34|nr:rhodanese-like domain-containing protein [Sulfurovum sp.]